MELPASLNACGWILMKNQRIQSICYSCQNIHSPSDSVCVVTDDPGHGGLPDLLQLLGGEAGPRVEAKVIEVAVSKLQSGKLEKENSI